MASAIIPPFQETPLASISATHDLLRTTFYTGKTKSIDFRVKQLRKLYWGIKDNEAAIVEALHQDLRKPPFEVTVAEVSWLLNDCIFMADNISKWAKDEKAENIPWVNAPLNAKIRKEPLGVCLVIGAFNYPVQLSLTPFIAAIASGNTVVLKPSEGSPASAAVIQRIVGEYLDPTAYTVVQGAIPETNALLDCKWDKIFFTGGQTVGTIIAKKAAETLTPVALELGGLNPAYVTKYADPRLAAKRILWAKTMNAGQTCLAMNYVLVDREILPAFVHELRVVLQEFFPKGAKASEDYGRIVNTRSFQRIKKMIDNTHGKILIGGTMDEGEKFIEPTVVQVDDIKDSLIVEEAFGPLLTLMAVDGVDEMISVANKVDRTPLGSYPFGNKTDTTKILNGTTSGGASINDGLFHGAIPTLEFGGVGSSGQGSYRGKASFDCFTHRRAVTTTPSWMERLIAVRYPPFAGTSKQKQFESMSRLKARFDREGRPTGLAGWFGTALGLGGDSPVSGIGRWLAVAAFAVAARQYVEAKKAGRL
ncbi:MAG: hypothetical protein M1824_001988 [Vezdaea acicularis]|nr:MAG: hypothetical protein M1824_001988 [Vezdaea acicularis]